MRVIRLTLSAFLFAASCGSAVPPPPPPGSALGALLAERKFVQRGCYPGSDTPEDQSPLQDAVDHAILDVAAMPRPVNAATLNARLQRLIADVDSFATSDRDEAYRYAIRIRRAAGLQGESHLFATSDDRVVELPC